MSAHAWVRTAAAVSLAATAAVIARHLEQISSDLGRVAWSLDDSDPTPPTPADERFARWMATGEVVEEADVIRFQPRDSA